MSRLPFCRQPLVIIDRCPADGHWCDGGELGQLKAVARAKGVAEALGGAKAPPAAKEMDGATDALLADLRKRPGNWGLVPPEVAREDLVAERKGHGISFRWGRRRRTYGLFDILWEILH